MQKNLPIQQNDDHTVVRYGSAVMMTLDWIDTTNMVAIAGRGTAKSTVIIAQRSRRCVELMPGAPFAIVANTYSNLINNIMPAVENGWKLQGWIEGVHYVRGKRPPEEWQRKCSIIVHDYKYCYSFYNGSVLFLGSLDNPSLLAGKSVVHLFFDEAKYASDAKAARVMPVLRGNAIAYGGCHLYGGVTVTTDMPDVTEGEYDWFFRYASEMDPQRILRIVQAASVRNELLQRYAGLQLADVAPSLIAALENDIAYYDGALRKLRAGQTYFVNLSSFANIDVLTPGYIYRLYNGALERPEFMKSVVGMRPTLKREMRFYTLFDETHKYTDGTITGLPATTSRDLRHLDPERPIDGGMDFGNMMSLVIGQDDGRTYRVHCNFYELPPGWLRELADQFLHFFNSHRHKVLNLYYDRAGNNYAKQGEDMAGKFKQMVERREDGSRTGWTVNLMSRDQSVIKQHAEYNFMYEMMAGRNPRLPRLLVDTVNCTEMVCSIEGARADIKYRGDKKIVSKVKKTERLPPKKLPRLSTNFSDAFKYLMMRPVWLDASKPDTVTAVPGVAVAVDTWIEGMQHR